MLPRQEEMPTHLISSVCTQQINATFIYIYILHLPAHNQSNNINTLKRLSQLIIHLTFARSHDINKIVVKHLVCVCTQQIYATFIYILHLPAHNHLTKLIHFCLCLQITKKEESKRFFFFCLHIKIINILNC